MSALRHSVRRGAYRDSLVLMQLQRALEGEPGVVEAAAMMATTANREILSAGDLWPEAAHDVRPDDLLVVVRAEDETSARAALERVDELLAGRSEALATEYRYRGLEAALAEHPEARWVVVSVPGAHAAAVAEEALAAGRHVLLFSDGVAVDDEVRLKGRARRRGLLLLGPDCGTAAVGGVGLGFANRWRRGGVGLVGASGTGLQAVGCGLDALGHGISQVLGTGGRDLAAEVGGTATLQALDLLVRDPATAVVVLVSKPPSPAVAGEVLRRASTAGKPVVVCLLGDAAPVPAIGSAHPVRGLDEAVEVAADLVSGTVAGQGEGGPEEGAAPLAGRIRGLFTGGTLATEVALGLRPWVHPLSTNLGLAGTRPLADPERGAGHAVVDLGSDELTAGRPHPMIDPGLRDRRLEREAEDPEVGLILLDLVLGDGAHPDPAGGLSASVERALATAREQERELEVVALLVGSENDPQGTAEQADRVRESGVRVVRGVGEMVRYAAGRVVAQEMRDRRPPPDGAVPVPLAALQRPAVVNVGLEAFAASLAEQGAEVVAVDWRPPAAGDPRLASILERMKRG